MQGKLLFCQRNAFARCGLDFIRTIERAIDVNEQTPRLIIVGLNFTGPLEKSSSALELAFNEAVASIEVMCFERIWIESDGTLQLGLRFLCFVLEVMIEEKGIAGGNAGVSAGVAGIELSRSGEHPPGDLIITLGVPMKEFPAA